MSVLPKRKWYLPLKTNSLTGQADKETTFSCRRKGQAKKHIYNRKEKHERISSGSFHKLLILMTKAKGERSVCLCFRFNFRGVISYFMSGVIVLYLLSTYPCAFAPLLSFFDSFKEKAISGDNELSLQPKLSLIRLTIMFPLMY